MAEAYVQSVQPDPTDQPIDVDALLRSSQTSFFESPTSVVDLLLSMVIGLALALILRWHYRRFATTLSGKENFSKVFPLVLLTTLLIITIVKSSLALSLGLVGALSIVRFRTPIKDPEELAYLFICIAIGLGLGASQILATVSGAGFIMVAVAVLTARRQSAMSKNLYLSINWSTGLEDRSAMLGAVNDILGKHATRCDLRRVDSRDGAFEAHYLVELASADQLSSLMDRLHGDCNADVTFVDQSSLPNA